MRIKALNGSKPHPDYKGWANFLNKCELRDEHDGVKYYGVTNCNYILFPCGTLLQNYGYHGRVMMLHIRERGRDAYLAEIKKDYRAWKKSYDAICSSIGRLTESLSRPLKRRHG